MWLYIAVVMLLHLIPLGEGGIDQYVFGPFRADYLLHSLVFIPLVPIALCCRLTSGRVITELRLTFRRPHSINSVVLISLLGVLLAIIAEGVQLWVFYRSYNPMDLLFNAAGVVIGGFLCFGLTLSHETL